MISNSKRFIRLIAVSTLVMLVTLACSLGGLSFGRNSASLEVKISEEQLKTLISGATSVSTTFDSSILEHVDNVELHDGFMRVFGSTTQNGETVSGSMDVSLSANNGVMDASITALDIPGMDINDPAIEEANQVLARELSNIIKASQGDVTFQNVEVQEGKLVLKIKVKLSKP